MGADGNVLVRKGTRLLSIVLAQTRLTVLARRASLLCGSSSALLVDDLLVGPKHLVSDHVVTLHRGLALVLGELPVGNGALDGLGNVLQDRLDGILKLVEKDTVIVSDELPSLDGVLHRQDLLNENSHDESVSSHGRLLLGLVGKENAAVALDLLDLDLADPNAVPKGLAVHVVQATHEAAQQRNGLDGNAATARPLHERQNVGKLHRPSEDSLTICSIPNGRLQLILRQGLGLGRNDELRAKLPLLLLSCGRSSGGLSLSLLVLLVLLVLLDILSLLHSSSGQRRKRHVCSLRLGVKKITIALALVLFIYGIL